MQHTFFQRLKYLFNPNSISFTIESHITWELKQEKLPNLPDGWYMLDSTQEPLHMTFSMVCVQVTEDNVVGEYVEVEEMDSLSDAWEACIKKINDKEYTYDIICG